MKPGARETGVHVLSSRLHPPCVNVKVTMQLALEDSQGKSCLDLIGDVIFIILSPQR